MIRLKIKASYLLVPVADDRNVPSQSQHYRLSLVIGLYSAKRDSEESEPILFGGRLTD